MEKGSSERTHPLLGEVRRLLCDPSATDEQICQLVTELARAHGEAVAADEVDTADALAGALRQLTLVIHLAGTPQADGKSRPSGRTRPPALSTPPSYMPMVAQSLHRAVMDATQADELAVADRLLQELKLLAQRSLASAEERAQLARALASTHAAACKREDYARAESAIATLREMVQRHGRERIPRSQLARALAHAHTAARNHDDAAAADQILEELRELAGRKNASASERTLLAWAVCHTHLEAQEARDAQRAFLLLTELRMLARRKGASTTQRLYFARALLDAVAFARNPGSPRYRSLRQECQEILAAHPDHPTSLALRRRLY